MSSRPSTTGDLDHMLDVLSNRTRRQLLGRLADAESDAEVRLGTVSPREMDIDLAVRLRHTHLPKLAGAGYIEWDRGVDAIHRGDHFDQIEPLVTLLQTHDEEGVTAWQ